MPISSATGYHLNVAVARLMELVSATRKAIDSGPGAADPAVREAAEALAVMLSLFAPYTAEECWEALGGPGAGVGPAGIPSVARTAWPTADPALLVQETVTCVVTSLSFGVCEPGTAIMTLMP